MAETGDYVRSLLALADAEKAFLDRVASAGDTPPNGPANAPAPPPAVSLMITYHQRAELRRLGFSDDAIRHMMPAEAHAALGLTEPSSAHGASGTP